MKRMLLAISLLASAAALPAPGQDLEPAVRTSSSAAAPATPPPTAAAPAASPVTPATAATPVPPAAPAKSARDAPPPAPAQLKSKAANPANGARSADKIELETTEISGNRELPKVMYIVPWRRADLGDLVGRPPNSLLDEALAPVDRDVFRRQNRYYDALQAGSSAQAGAASGQPAARSGAPSTQDEK